LEGKKEGKREWEREHLLTFTRGRARPHWDSRASPNLVDDFRYVPANFWKHVGQLHNFILWAHARSAQSNWDNKYSGKLAGRLPFCAGQLLVARRPIPYLHPLGLPERKGMARLNARYFAKRRECVFNSENLRSCVCRNRKRAWALPVVRNGDILL